jgi:hypothetical protein
MVALCDRWHCLPSQLEQEDAGVLRMLALVALDPPEGVNGGG